LIIRIVLQIRSVRLVFLFSCASLAFACNSLFLLWLSLTEAAPLFREAFNSTTDRSNEDI
jgi:hypothetical protein